MTKPVTEVQIELVPRRTLGGGDLWGVRVTIPTYSNFIGFSILRWPKRRWMEPMITYAGLTTNIRESAFPDVFSDKPFWGSLVDATAIANLIRNEPSDHYKVKPICLD